MRLAGKRQVQRLPYYGGLRKNAGRAMPELERLPEEHIYRAYGVYLLTSQHRIIRRLKRVYEPSAHGNKAWWRAFS